jgi:hypothetical protein
VQIRRDDPKSSHFVVRREPYQASFLLKADGRLPCGKCAPPFYSREGPDMRVHRILLSLAISIGCGIAANPASSQEYRGTFEQQMACTPDVFRLCSEHMPDASRIVGCLRRNTAQLSNPCRAVFESKNANASQPVAPPRGRTVQPRPDYVQPRPDYVQPRPDDDQ